MKYAKHEYFPDLEWGRIASKGNYIGLNGEIKKEHTIDDVITTS